jgi:hypothetical protein
MTLALAPRTYAHTIPRIILASGPHIATNHNTPIVEIANRRTPGTPSSGLADTKVAKRPPQAISAKEVENLLVWVTLKQTERPVHQPAYAKYAK